MMMKKLLLLVLFCNFSYAQVFINELDADTSGSDILEFIELKSTTPNFSLDGYVLVFYNGLTTGTGSLSYYAYDLDGFVTDVNGIVHFGNPTVNPSPFGIIPVATIQNGPDAVGLYQANASDFPLDTPATALNLIDAIANSNSSTKPTTLMSILGITTCTNENQTSSISTHSIQRKNDGTYEVKTPTPGVINEGIGIPLNYISVTTNVSSISEGQNLIITYTTAQPVVGSPLGISITLNNGGFTTSDFTGNLNLSIPIGATNTSTIIQILDDSNNEGDEELKISSNPSLSNYSFYNNNKVIRVNEINFIALPFGTPLSPTHGIVSTTAPTGYYDSIEGLSGSVLKQALQDIIANPAVVRAQNYGDIEYMLKEADQNPANSSQVWLMYVEQPRSKIDFQDSNSNIGKWNREHIYPQSRGGFANGTLSTSDGIDIWLPTNADDILAGHADGHHLRAEDGSENSARSNRDYGLDYNGPVGSQGSWHGDVARSLFYMAVRYNALSLVNGNPPDTTLHQLGDLATLLVWNQSDTSDDFEMNRNNIIYNWQQNRNPFIDYPDLANYIWGAKVGQPWFSNLSVKEDSILKIGMYPNPTQDYIVINGLTSIANVTIYSISGVKIYEGKYSNNEKLYLNLTSGMYMVKVNSDGKTSVKKLFFNGLK
jgi:hypothetical protein